MKNIKQYKHGKPKIHILYSAQYVYIYTLHMKYIYFCWLWFLAYHAFLLFGEGTASPPTPSACRGSLCLCLLLEGWTFWFTDCVCDVLFYVRWLFFDVFRGCPTLVLSKLSEYNLDFIENTLSRNKWTTINIHIRGTCREHCTNIAKALQKHPKIMP
jgi:hypothetical protein